jgi:hypothetical protein
MKASAHSKAARTNERTKAMDTEIGKTAIRHDVVRLEIRIHESYDDFLRRFESAVPMFDRARGAALIERKAPWSEIVADVAASAPSIIT